MSAFFDFVSGKLIYSWELIGSSGNNYITRQGRVIPKKFFNKVFDKTGGGQSPAALAFLEYVTTSVSSFTLRSTETVNYEVDWGDGTTESLTTNDPTHTYSSAGEYTIKVTPAEGSTYRPYFNNAVSDTSIASVSGTGGSQLGTTLSDSWEGASNMTSFSSDIDTSSVTIFSRTWYNCTGLTSFPLLNTSSGTDFVLTWANCNGLTSFPLLNVSNGTNFNSTWNGCSGLTSFPLINTSSGTLFFATWSGCNSLTSFPLLNVSGGISFSSAWQFCFSLTSFPLLDTSKGTNFQSTWQSCSGLTSFPLLNVSNGINFDSTWRNCLSLTTFPANMFDTTGTLVSTAFNNSWANCALTAQSIENILVSLDTNGASNITLSLNGGSNAAKTTWSAAANTAYTNLINKGWTISYNA